MPSEDYSEFTSRVPSCYFFVGTGNPETGKIWGHHHPKFDIDERCLGIGVEVMVGAALHVAHNAISCHAVARPSRRGSASRWVLPPWCSPASSRS